MTAQSFRQTARTLQLVQFNSQACAISKRASSVSGQSVTSGGGRFSRSSATMGRTRFVQHARHPRGSFFETWEARNRASPIEITRAANRAPGSSCNVMASPMRGVVPLRQNPTKISTAAYQQKLVNAGAEP